MTDIEVWKTAVYDGEPYEGFEVSNWGRVKNLNYRNTGKERLVKTSEDKDGYFKVNLRKNGKWKKCLVHRLVAQTFLPNPENKPCINHKIEGDKGKKINMVFFNEDGSVDEKKSTIEWATYKENNDYGTHNERISKAMTNGKKSKRVLQFTLDGEFIREWPSTREIERQLGFDSSAVCRCCNGKQKSAYGFLFMYK